MYEFMVDLGRFPFLRHALLAGILASIACGIMGSYVVTRRISYIAGSISHSTLGGIGAALFLRKTHHIEWLHPIYGAAISAIAAAVIIGLVSMRAKEREDTVISAVWAIGMATGILFIFKTPGYNEDLMSYLFGNILLVTSADLWLIAGLDLLVIAIGLYFYNQFFAVCFDREFARLRGLNVEVYYLMLLCLVALTVVLLVTVVGVVMVIALLVLPAAMAGRFTRKLWQMMAGATVISIMITTVGLMLSYGTDLPVGGTTIFLTGTLYILITAVTRLFFPVKAG